ncbi:MAG: hypothetical protein HY788_00540 [Deltaproteobacteria bacterium]|nr:hypothetical protein [Deltaproteobacteria bacterium]
MIYDIKTVLETIADDLPGFVASAAVLVEDGLPIAGLSKRADVDPEAISAHMTSIVQSNLKALKLVGQDQVTDDILITTNDYYFLIRHKPGKPYFLFIMTERNEWLGRVRLRVKKYETEIIRILEGK